MDLCAQHRDRRVGVLGKPRPLVRELALLDEQDRGLDLLRRQVARRALERELVQGLVGLAGELRLRPVRVEVPRRGDQLEGHRDLLVEGVEVDEPLPLHVEQQPAANPFGQVGTPAPEVLECLPPIRQTSPPEWDQAACQAGAL
jgi:hypothetical protein